MKMPNGMIAAGRSALRRGHRPRDQRGFTLLELLVAFTLLALVSLIMLGGLHFGTRVWERTTAIGDDGETVEASQRFLRRTLNAVYPAWQSDRPGSGHVLFDGQSHALTFIGPAPAPVAPDSYLQFTLERSADGALSIDWRPRDAPAADAAQAVLMAGISGVDFAYFGPDTAGNSAQWWDSWSGRTAGPLLIRVHIRFPPGDRRAWPDMVIRPEIMVDVRCVYDPVYRGCRGR